MSELAEPLQELKLVNEEEPVEELKPVDVEEKDVLVEEGCPVNKEHVEELKPVDVEEKAPVTKEDLKRDKKLPFIFEWVEVSSETCSKSVTGEEYPVAKEERSVSKEELDCDKEPLPTQDVEEESLAVPPESVTKAAEPGQLEYYTFSLTNPRFDLLITHSNIKPRYHVILPQIIVRKLPRENVPVVLTSYGKKWTMTYNGRQVGKTLKGWKTFAVDNKLKIGDCCFFELTEKCKTGIVFKVVIMKTDSHYDAEGNCGTPEEPILIE